MKMFVFSALFAVLLAASVPSRQAHVDHFESELVEGVRRDVDPESTAALIGAGVASFIGGGLLKSILKLARYDNYLLFSTMRTPGEAEQGELLSVGLLGQVVVLRDKERPAR